MYRTREGNTRDRGTRIAEVVAGAEGGEALSFFLGEVGGRGEACQVGLKNESFSDFLQVGAGAFSIRGVASASVDENEFLEVRATGAEKGSGGRGEVEENGEAKKACVLLPLEVVGEIGGWWSASEEVEVRERVETEDGVVRMLKCDDRVEDPDEYDDEEGPKPKP